MTQLQTVEPRYVIECFPVIVALGALGVGRSPRARRKIELGFVAGANRRRFLRMNEIGSGRRGS